MTDEAELSALFPAQEWGVEVVVGPTPAVLQGLVRDDGQLQMSHDAFLTVVDGVGRMLVTSDRVTVDPAPGHSADELDYILYAWAPRLVRVLREEYVLHASAVAAADGSALAVLGYSGAGKSTTVTALARSGHPLIVDDVLPVDLEDGVGWVHGWERPVHLTDQAAHHFGVADGPRVGNLADTKLLTSLPATVDRRPLRWAVELVVDEQADTVRHSVLLGAERVQAVVHHANTSGTSAAGGRRHSFFAWATALAAAIEVHRITRPAHGWHLDPVVEAITAIMGGTDPSRRT